MPLEAKLCIETETALIHRWRVKSFWQKNFFVLLTTLIFLVSIGFHSCKYPSEAYL